MVSELQYTINGQLSRVAITVMTYLSSGLSQITPATPDTLYIVSNQIKRKFI